MSEKAEVVDLVPQQKTDLPAPVAKRGISETQWRTLCNALYPGAASNSVLMVWDYCTARRLDPMKKPVHIVPMRVKDAKTGEYGWRDVVLPGVYEYRTTAHRTGEYLGHSEPEYGPEIEVFGVKAPSWCSMTMYRWNARAQQKVPFPVEVSFIEVVATKKDQKTGEITANERWTRAPKQMLTKCTEAAGLREAFPEEIGGEPTAEEMDGRHMDIDVVPLASETVPPAVVVFDRLPEGLRDNIEKAFAALGFSPAQRLTKLNEYLGAENAVPDEAATALLEWCRDEFAKRKTGQPRAKKDGDNGRGKLVAAGDSAPAVGGAPAGPVEPDVRAASGGGAGTVVPGGDASGPPALTADEIFTPAKQESELF